MSSSYSTVFWLSLFEKSQKHNLQNSILFQDRKINKRIIFLFIQQSKGSKRYTIICKYVDMCIANSYSIHLYTLLKSGCLFYPINVKTAEPIRTIRSPHGKLINDQNFKNLHKFDLHKKLFKIRELFVLFYIVEKKENVHS